MDMDRLMTVMCVPLFSSCPKKRMSAMEDRELRDELQSVAVDANHRGSTLFVILFVFKLIVSEVQTSLRSAVH